MKPSMALVRVGVVCVYVCERERDVFAAGRNQWEDKSTSKQQKEQVERGDKKTERVVKHSYLVLETMVMIREMVWGV